MKRFLLAGVGCVGAHRIGHGGRPHVPGAAAGAGTALQPALQLDRLLCRHQRRRRLGRFELGRHRQLQRLGRSGRPDRRLQFPDQPVRGRHRGRYRLGGHQRQHDAAACSAAIPGTPGSARSAAVSATPSTAFCPTSRPASGSATFARPGRSFPAAATPTPAGHWAGGFEVAIFGSAFTAKVEYLYVGLGDFNCGLNCGLLPSSNVSFYANLLRGGINVRF